MKKLIVFFFCITLFISRSHAQTACDNSDFSDGDFTNWIGSTAQNSEGIYTTIVTGIVAGTPNSPPSNAGQMTIMNAPGTDPNTYGALSVIPPGGTSSCRLGNDLCTDCATTAMAARLIYTIPAVTPANCVFIYQYAVVLQDPSGAGGHTAAECPKFTIYVRNSSGAVIGGVCGQYEVTAQTGLPGFTDVPALSSVCDNTIDVLWKDWTTEALDLSPYMGQPIGIEFTSYDCSLGAHFGYAYISCSCGTLSLSQQCSTNSVTLTAPAGFANYLWIPGGQTTQSITIMSPVSGTVDSVRCTAVTGCSVEIGITINFQPVVFTVNSPTICSGQTATLSATGTGYTYEWSPATGLSATTGATVTANPTTTTTYIVTATASGGCTNSSQAVVTVAQTVANAGPPSTVCLGQSATLDASGSTGGAPLTYNWSGGLGTNATVTVTPTATTTYTVTVTSGGMAGCTSTASVTVTVASSLVLAVTPAAPSICLSGSTTLTVSGATTYTWVPSTGLSVSTGTTVTASPTATTTYTVTGYSGTCSASTSVTVTVGSLVVSVTPALTSICAAGGSAVLTASGATSYTWTPATGLSASTGATVTANPTANTTYTVIGTDGTCTNSASATVDVVSIGVTASETDENCGQSNGTATAIPTGTCASGWTYAWSTTPAQTTQTASHLPAGTYTVTLTCGTCSTSASTTINNIGGPSVAISSIINTSCGYANGSAVASGTGNNPPFNYQWSNTQIGANLVNVAGGTYTVTLTDAVGCTATNTVTIAGSSRPTTTVIPQNELCDRANGTATVNATGGTPPYTYMWNNHQTTPTATGLTASAYFVTVTDANGCTATDVANIYNVPGPTADFNYHPSFLTPLNDIAYFTNNSSGNIVNWQWNFGDGSMGSGANPNHTYPYVGNYVVTLIVTDNNGCTDTVTDTIKEKEIYTFYIPNAFTPNNDGFNEGFAPKGINVDPNNYNEYIFDRWGNEIFHTSEWDVTNHQAQPWNGTKNNSGNYTDVIMGVYVYRITLKEIGGIKHEYIGRISLIP